MTTATKPPEPRRMLTLLHQQRDGYQQLIELSSQQSQLISDGHPEQLLSLLAKRQSLIQEMADLGREIGEYQSHWPDVAVALGPDQADQARALLRDVEQLLARILEQDEQDRARLAASHQQAGRELKQAAAAPRALGAYRVASAQSPRFTDRQG